MAEGGAAGPSYVMETLAIPRRHRKTKRGEGKGGARRKRVAVRHPRGHGAAARWENQETGMFIFMTSKRTLSYRTEPEMFPRGGQGETTTHTAVATSRYRKSLHECFHYISDCSCCGLHLLNVFSVHELEQRKSSPMLKWLIYRYQLISIVIRSCSGLH